jgi:uncharacterized protein (DUF697 family)
LCKTLQVCRHAANNLNEHHVYFIGDPLKKLERSTGANLGGAVTTIENTVRDESSPEPTSANTDRQARAHSIITKYAAFGFGGGIIPFPMMDIAAVAAVQLKMLADLAELYEVEFVDNWGKSSLSSLVGGSMPHVLAAGTLGSLIKAIPVVGSAVGMASVPLMAAGITYAVGKVFIQHFESGGTFLDFDAVAARTLFREQFGKGKELFRQQAQQFRNWRGKRPAEAAAAQAAGESASTAATSGSVHVEAGGAEADVTGLDPLRRRTAKPKEKFGQP